MVLLLDFLAVGCRRLRHIFLGFGEIAVVSARRAAWEIFCQRGLFAGVPVREYHFHTSVLT